VFSTLGWPEQTEFLKKFHSTDVLVTGFDIIFFWVARMIMLTMHLIKNEDGTPQVPFKTVYVHGLVRDGQGQKMSKSKGNVLDPLDIIDGISSKPWSKTHLRHDAAKTGEEDRQADPRRVPEGIASYGTDALRFTFCSLASTGRDIKFDMGRVEGYRNFCNKIWNAARYVLDKGEDCGQNGEAYELSLADRWIISQLQRTEAEVTRQLEQFRFDLAAKRCTSSSGTSTATGTWNCPSLCCGTRTPRLSVSAAPVAPWCACWKWPCAWPIRSCRSSPKKSGSACAAGRHRGKTIMLQPWPVANETRIDQAAEGHRMAQGPDARHA
jgi:valyl-tRNA synthetase